MRCLAVVAVFDLALDRRELDGHLLIDRVRAIDYGIATLHVEQIELDGVARVNVFVGEEELALEDQIRLLVDVLLTECFGVVEPGN